MGKHTAKSRGLGCIHDMIAQKQKHKQKIKPIKLKNTGKQTKHKFNTMFVIVLNNKKHIGITLHNCDKTTNTMQQNPTYSKIFANNIQCHSNCMLSYHMYGNQIQV